MKSFKLIQNNLQKKTDLESGMKQARSKEKKENAASTASDGKPLQ